MLDRLSRRSLAVSNAFTTTMFVPSADIRSMSEPVQGGFSSDCVTVDSVEDMTHHIDVPIQRMFSKGSQTGQARRASFREVGEASGLAGKGTVRLFDCVKRSTRSTRDRIT